MNVHIYTHALKSDPRPSTGKKLSEFTSLKVPEEILSAFLIILGFTRFLEITNDSTLRLPTSLLKLFNDRGQPITKWFLGIGPGGAVSGPIQRPT